MTLLLPVTDGMQLLLDNRNCNKPRDGTSYYGIIKGWDIGPLQNMI